MANGHVLGAPHDVFTYLVSPPEYPDHVVQDIIVKEGTYGMIFGEASSAKSLIAQALILALASGERFAGHFPVVGGHRNVLFLDLDQGADTSLRRFAKLCNWDEYDEDWKEMVANRVFHFSPIMPFSLIADISELANQIKMNDIDVLVIDCLARTLGGMDENTTQAADAYFQRVKALQKLSLDNGRPLTVIVVHHSRKVPPQVGGGKLPPQDDMRGASAWRDSLDFQIRAWKRGDLVGLNKLKERNAEVPDGRYTFRIVDKFDQHMDAVAVRFVYEPDAEIRNAGDVVWGEMRQLTEGQQDKGIKLADLSTYLKLNKVKGTPHTGSSLRAVVYMLCRAGRVQCSRQDFQARDPRKVFWTVG
jgi:hypothetical protein